MEDPAAYQRYLEDLDARKTPFDILMVSTFIVCVPGCDLVVEMHPHHSICARLVCIQLTCIHLFVTVRALAFSIISKMALVNRVLTKTSASSQQHDHTADIKTAYARFRLGLATGSDHKDLADFIDQLDSNTHIRAGKRLWRHKQLVAHLNAEQLAAALAEIEEQLPKSHALGYHFTDLDACRLILDSSQGIRASSVGQLGGGVSICLASPTELGWAKHGGYDFAKKVGEQLWGSKWYEVMPGEPTENDHADWGKYHNKLECVFVLRVPSAKNRDQSQIVPGRPNVYIVPESACEPGLGQDTYSYYSNLNIESCLVLKAPTTDKGRSALDSLASKPLSTRVKCVSDRDVHGGMVDVQLSEVDAEDRIEDVLTANPQAPWCPTVASFTAMVSQPQSRANSGIAVHHHLQEKHAGKQVWPENVSRFTTLEMEAALYSIDQSLLRYQSLAYYYTSATNAAQMCKEGPGIQAVRHGADYGVRVCLRSPTDLGWEKYGGGDFQDRAGTAIWGPHWRDSHSNDLQALLVLEVPTKELGDPVGDAFTISQSLLATDAEPPYYANAHIHKSYVLQQPTQNTCAAASDEKDLAMLFKQVDVDGDGQITQGEAMRYFREQGIDKDEQSLASMFEAFDSNGDGTIDLSEFPRLLDAARRSMAQTTPYPLPAPRPVKPSAVEKAPSRNRTSSEQQASPKEQSQVAVLFDRVDRDGSGLISFDEFFDWWSHKQLSTGLALDKVAATKIQERWNELDKDGSGSLDKDEFESVMTDLATSEWKEAFDQNKCNVYYYNTRTKETRWRQPDAQAAIEDFMTANGLTALRKPPPLAVIRPPLRGVNAASGTIATTTNPLSEKASQSRAFDVEEPRPLDTLQRRSQRSKAKLRAASRAAQLPPTGTRSTRPRRPLPPLNSLRSREGASSTGGVSEI
eukprot:COSAG02_NODE_3692_length_6376_cov_17.973395_5_plen_917_part_00